MPAPAGSGPGFRRPVLIVQSNSFNSSRIATVVVAVITSWDALIVHAASKGGASVLYTEDLNAGQVMEGVRIVDPLLDPSVHDSKSTAAPIVRGEQGDLEERTRLE